MIKIGIVGMSPKNGHPYSWSSIINGYFDADEITNAGYSIITDYLIANKDTIGIHNAKVTHVWTQERELSKSIAKSCKIKHVVENMEDMIGFIDAVILARDDPRNHVSMARPFINADIPIFIDKPLAITTEDLNYFSDASAKGKFLMSCSSMRYAHECRTVKTELASLGEIVLATAVGKKDWEKYGVHLLEGLFVLLDDPKPVSVRHISKTGQDIVYIEFEKETQAVVQIFMEIAPTFQISLFGKEGWRLIEIQNSYSMFKDNMIEFIKSVQEGSSRLSFEKTENIILTLIGAKESLKKGGKTIDLTRI